MTGSLFPNESKKKEVTMWTHIEDTTPKARKNHRCYLCGLMIPKGLEHVKRFGADSGEGLSSFRMHYQCERVAQAWSQDDWERMPDEWSFRNEDLPPIALAEIQSMETPERMVRNELQVREPRVQSAWR